MKNILKNIFLSIKYECNISHGAKIVYDDLKNIFFDRNVYIGANTIIYCTNEDAKTGRQSTLSIGEGTYIGEMNNIRVGGASIVIGKKCLIAQNVNIIGSNHSTKLGQYITDQEWDDRKIDVRLGDDVWLGCGVTVLPGVVIGSGAIIAAGAVVTKNIEENSIYGGVPARFIKFRE